MQLLFMLMVIYTSYVLKTDYRTCLNDLKYTIQKNKYFCKLVIV